MGDLVKTKSEILRKLIDWNFSNFKPEEKIVIERIDKSPFNEEEYDGWHIYGQCYEIKEEVEQK